MPVRSQQWRGRGRSDACGMRPNGSLRQSCSKTLGSLMKSPPYNRNERLQHRPEHGQHPAIFRWTVDSKWFRPVWQCRTPGWPHAIGAGFVLAGRSRVHWCPHLAGAE